MHKLTGSCNYFWLIFFGHQCRGLGVSGSQVHWCLCLQDCVTVSDWSIIRLSPTLVWTCSISISFADTLPSSFSPPPCISVSRETIRSKKRSDYNLHKTNAPILTNTTLNVIRLVGESCANTCTLHLFTVRAVGVLSGLLRFPFIHQLS